MLVSARCIDPARHARDTRAERTFQQVLPSSHGHQNDNMALLTQLALNVLQDTQAPVHVNRDLRKPSHRMQTAHAKRGV